MPNRLARETSPYLLQHADNPVQWYPWGEEALGRARAEDKPILLSIGYSACHWCHVMAHESFEDPEVAAVMNELFVNVKVDREERPDLDQIYQAAHAMLSRRSGGWPLTVVLTPDQVPFFAGTYFPKAPRHGLPGFPDLLARIADAYRQQGAAIAEQNERLKEALASTNPRPGAAFEMTLAPLDAAIEALQAGFDPVDGGFGGAPKFPRPSDLELCLRRHVRTGSAQPLQMARLTLERMAEGGIFDHVGGGFCRYSVDAQWTIPHFEKMLYDNAQLLPLYADAWRLTGEARFADTARATARWVIDEMQSPAGGYYCALDADSEGEEGRYYVWTPESARAALTAEEFAVVAPHFGLDQPPNFEGHAWHLRVAVALPEVAERLGVPLSRVRSLVASARTRLAAARAARVRPGLDDKVLAGWNALMIGGLAHAGRAMGERAWVQSARRALDFVHASLWHDGRLHATWKDGRSRLDGYLDDYAFLLAALLEMLQAEFRRADFDWACAIADTLLAQFEDPHDGGFYFTAHDHERLIHRAKSGHDNATPSGNGVVARALLELGHLAGDPRYLEAAERTLKLFWPQFSGHPGGFASMLIALDTRFDPPTTAILRGEPATTSAWASALAAQFRPGQLVIDAGDREVPPALAKPGAPGPGGSDGTEVGTAGPGGRVASAPASALAWVCPGTQCLPPVSDLPALTALLAAPERR